MSGLRAGIQRRLLKELVESKAAGQAEGEHVRLEAVDEHDLDQWRVGCTHRPFIADSLGPARTRRF